MTRPLGGGLDSYESVAATLDNLPTALTLPSTHFTLDDLTQDVVAALGGPIPSQSHVSFTRFTGWWHGNFGRGN